MSPVALLKRLSPLREYLSAMLKRDIRIETTTKPDDFTFRTISKRYDMVLTSPTFALMALDKGDYRLLATQRQAIQGQLIVMAYSPISQPEELAHKIIGVPPESGLLGQLIRPFLQELQLTGTRAPTLRFFNSHNDAFYALRMNNVDAAFLSTLTTKHLQEQKNSLFRVITNSAPYPGLTMLISSEFEPELQQKLRKIILNLHKNKSGALALKQSNLPPFASINREELEQVRVYVPEQEH